MTEARIQKLVDDVKHSIAKLHDQVAALEAAVAGENPVGAAIITWRRKWKAHYGADYTMTAADKGQIKRLVTQLGVDDVTRRMTAFFSDRDLFLAKNRHPMNLFVGGINRFAQPVSMRPEDLPDEIPADCRHDPPCRSDADHTRKRAAEMRA